MSLMPPAVIIMGIKRTMNAAIRAILSISLPNIILPAQELLSRREQSCMMYVDLQKIAWC